MIAHVVHSRPRLRATSSAFAEGDPRGIDLVTIPPRLHPSLRRARPEHHRILPHRDGDFTSPIPLTPAGPGQPPPRHQPGVEHHHPAARLQVQVRSGRRHQPPADHAARDELAHRRTDGGSQTGEPEHVDMIDGLAGGTLQRLGPGGERGGPRVQLHDLVARSSLPRQLGPHRPLLGVGNPIPECRARPAAVPPCAGPPSGGRCPARRSRRNPAQGAPLSPRPSPVIPNLTMPGPEPRQIQPGYGRGSSAMVSAATECARSSRAHSSHRAPRPPRPRPPATGHACPPGAPTHVRPPLFFHRERQPPPPGSARSADPRPTPARGPSPTSAAPSTSMPVPSLTSVERGTDNGADPRHRQQG